MVGTLQVADEVSRKVLVLVGDERVCGSLLAGTTCPTDAVRVRVDVACHVVVDHRADVRNVQTTRYSTRRTDTLG